MSITFIATKWDEGKSRPVRMFPCDCTDRWMTDCDAAGDMDAWPDPYSCEHCRAEINLANVNAMELLSWLDITPDYGGTIEARELAARCRRRLWDEPRNHDTGVDGFVEKREDRATVIYCGRREGYLREKTELLLALAEKAGDGDVSWS